MYKYGADGIRTEKTVNGTVHKYYAEGETLHFETRTNAGGGMQKLWYYYDGSGICGVEYNGTVYYFQKNLQGDVTRIYDGNGSLVAQYVYDAWGNHKVLNANGTEMTDEAFIGNVNPIRYRGYYYDEETGLYYLQSRYYDPEVGRFINADDIDYIEPETLMGCNLYAYCGNNPVMYVDPTGCAPKWWQSILIGLGIIIGAALIATAITFTGGSAAAFFIAAGKVALGGLKIAAVAGIASGLVRMGKTAILGGSFGEIGQSLILGFSDGFLAGSLYAGANMLLSAGLYGISGLFNNGNGWVRGKFIGGYQTPKTPGVSIFTYLGGINGGRTFGVDLDIYHGIHMHFKWAEKVNNKYLKKILGKVSRHRWMEMPILIGVGIGLSNGWSEW